MSKSLGNVIDPLPLVDAYGSDPVRWATRAATLGRDGSASEDSLHERYERARKRARQPRVANDGDDRPLPER